MIHKIYEPRLEELSELERELFELYLDKSGFKKPAPSHHERNYIRNYVHDQLKQKGNITILDLGCGDANALRETKKKFGSKVYTVGVDIGTPPEHLSEQDLSYVDEYVTTPIEFLPLEWSNRFDYIASLQCLRYTFFPFRALEEVARVLKPRAGEAIIDANYDAHWSHWDLSDKIYNDWLKIIEKNNLDNPNYKSKRIITDNPVLRFMAKMVDNFHDNIFTKAKEIEQKYNVKCNIERNYNDTWGWMVNSVEMRK